MGRVSKAQEGPTQGVLGGVLSTVSILPGEGDSQGPVVMHAWRSPTAAEAGFTYVASLDADPPHPPGLCRVHFYDALAFMSQYHRFLMSHRGGQ